MSNSCRVKNNNGCSNDNKGELKNTYDEIVKDYREKGHFKNKKKEMDRYKNFKNFEEAIERACSKEDSTHQFRVDKEALAKAKIRLRELKAKVLKIKNFDELYNLFEKEIEVIRGIGLLTLYDISNRIGAYLEIKPELVYFQRGAKQGLKSIIPSIPLCDRKRNRIERDKLPNAFLNLESYHIENLLCIYEEDLEYIKLQAQQNEN